MSNVAAAVLRAAALAGAVLALAACAGSSVQPGPPVPAPDLKAGDRWVYRGIDGFRLKIEWEETHEIASVAPGAIAVDVKVRSDTTAAANLDRAERWSAPGVVLEGAVYDVETRVFEPPLIRFQFPLTVGTSWRQSVRDTTQPPGPYGPIQRSVRVQGFESVTTPAGTFDALRMRVLMTLDDETFWRWPTQCEYTVWYAASVGGVVQEHRRSFYYDKGGLDAVAYHPGQNAVIQLVSYKRG